MESLPKIAFLTERAGIRTRTNPSRPPRKGASHIIQASVITCVITI